MLVAAKMQISTLLNRLSNEDHEATLQLVYDLLSQTVAISRSLTAELSPPVLYDIGLGPALMWLARSQFEKQGLQVEVLFDPSGEPRLEDMRVFLFDAIREILFNVVKHSGVKKARVECFRGSDDLIRVVVSDEGKGFDPANLKMGERSEGLGLFSIQQRLKHMGGRMEIDSAPDSGTRITIVGPQFPMVQKKPSPTANSKSPGSPAEASARAGKIRVVLADDHHIIRDGLARVLRAEPDIEVVGEAANGAQAINLARSLSPDIVVMDVSMPVLSGIEATAEILRDMPDVKVIGLSMHEEGDVSSAIRQAGAAAYVTKGGSPEALVKAIHKVAGGKS
jgi:CheY-like chemotaxis protein